MKKRIPVSILSLVATLLFSTSLMAQETTEVTIKVTKDGKVVKDTTYQFDDATEAKHAVKMMEVMSGDEKNMMKYNYNTDSDSDKHINKMVIISEDGEKRVIKELHGDSLVWITEEESDGEHVIVMKSGDGETFDILIDEDFEKGDNVKRKTMNVIVEEDEHGTWHVDEKELKHVDEDVYIIKGGDDVEVELKEIMEEHGGENVKVIVIKTDIDEDHDHDADADHDEDKKVEVEVEKIVKKKSKEQ